MLDSGATHALIGRRVAAGLGFDFDAIAAQGETIALAGVGMRSTKAVRVVVPAITIGDLSIRNLPVYISETSLGDDTDLLLGRKFLNQTHLWISNSHHAVIFQVPSRPSTPPAGP